jgi:hypothetical protein
LVNAPGLFSAVAGFCALDWLFDAASDGASPQGRR